MSSSIVVVLLLVLLNGFFVMSEMALVSAKRSRLLTAAEQGRAGAKSAISLLEDPTTLLSAIQIGITLITIFTGLYSASHLRRAAGRHAQCPGRACQVRRRRRHRASWWCSSPSSRSSSAS